MSEKSMELAVKDFLQIGIVDIGLHNLAEYAATLEDSLSHKLKRFKSWAEKETCKLTKEQQEDFYEFYRDDHWELSEVFPNILRASLFVTCYSFLEHQLERLCKHYHKQHNYSIGLADLQRKGIFRAQTYLKKVVGVDFPDQTSAWEDIVAYNHIRNIIVHNDRRLDDSDRARHVESFMNANSSISLDDRKRIQFTKDFCPEVIGTLKNFFLDLFRLLP